MEKPAPTYVGKIWIDREDDYRKYIVKRCIICHKLWWVRKSYSSKYSSNACQAKTRMKFNGLCKCCGKQIPRTSRNGIQFSPRKFCSRQCAGEYFQADRHSQWRGGSYIGNGYKFVRIGKDKYIPEHRLIMEKYLGRKLMSKEFVHHMNHDSLDNRIENLMVMSNAMHAKLHDRLRRWVREGNHWTRCRK